MKNKVLTTVGGLNVFMGFFLMIGIVGRGDLADEIGEYLPWYWGWQYLLIGLVLMCVGTIILNLVDKEYWYE